MTEDTRSIDDRTNSRGRKPDMPLSATACAEISKIEYFCVRIFYKPDGNSQTPNLCQRKVAAAKSAPSGNGNKKAQLTQRERATAVHV